MKCTISNTRLDDKLQNIISKVRDSLRGHKMMERQLAGIITSSDFVEYIKENYSAFLNKGNDAFDITKMTYSDISKFNANKIVSALKEYYKNNYSSVAVTAVKLSEDRLNGFKSGRSKVCARDYCGTLIITNYIDELRKPANKRKSMSQIIFECSNYIETEFYAKYLNPLVDKILADNSKYSEEAKNAAVAYRKAINELTVAQRDFKDAATIIKSNNYKSKLLKLQQLRSKETDSDKVKNLDDAINQLKNRIKEESSKINTLKNNIELKQLSKYITAQEITTVNFGTSEDSERISQIIEYANLVSQVRHNPDEWFFQVRYSKKVTNIAKLFNKVNDLDVEFDEMNENDDIVLQKYNGESVDETAKSWEDELYNNFTDTVDGKLKMYLSTISRLDSPYNEDSAQTPNEDNELGVRTTYDFSYIVNQIYSFGKFNSPDELISALDKKFNSTKKLYGLGKIVSDMKHDFVFANLIYCTFAKPIANKTMMTISNNNGETSIALDYSNPAAFPLIDLTFKLMNNIRTVIKSEDVYDDIIKLKNDINDINAYNFNDSNINAKIIDELYNTIHKHFYTIKKEDVNNLLDTNNIKDSVNTIYKYLHNILSEVVKLQENIRNEEIRINKANEQLSQQYKAELAQYNIDMALGIFREAPKKPTYQRLEQSSFNLSPTLNKNIINLANEIIGHTDSKVKLNTKNAEGNTASDVIKQCYVTRLFEQINGETEEDALAGLKSLAEYFTQGTDIEHNNQYSNTPILFGLKNIDGTPVTNAEGLFKKDATGHYVPTEHAKEILKYSLFDGIKNDISNTGQLYNQTRKTDWQITLYQAYINSVNDFSNGERTNYVGNQETAVYSMRIPSDAPKIFFIKAPKYSDTMINGVSNVRLAIYNHVMNELQMFVNGIKNAFVLDNATGLYTLTTNKRNLFGRAYYDEKIANKIRLDGAKAGKKEDELDYTSAFFDGKQLLGNMFHFMRLFKLDNYNAESEIMNALSLYGGSNALFEVINGKLCLNINDSHSKFIGFDYKGDLKFNPNIELSKEIYDITSKWCDAYVEQAIKDSSDFIDIYKRINKTFNPLQFKEFLLNYVNMNITYDDLFEGDYKYYNGSRDFLKRTKEAQAGGSVYADGSVLSNNSQVLDNEEQPITIKTATEERTAIISNGKPLYTRNGFKAVTIYNSVKPADNAEQLQRQLNDLFLKQGYNEEDALNRAKKIAHGYFVNSKMNDAQSYITFEEFIRRKVADGTYDEYEDIISQILQCRELRLKRDSINKLTNKDEWDAANKEFTDAVCKINLDDVNARIQVQKNFYYDKQFDVNTGEFYSRQIKNAEFVIIPELLPDDSDLIKVAAFMEKNNIDQLNTAETSKAAKKNIFTIFDDNGNLVDNFEDNYKEEYSENYYYKYLYKQQDVPQHLMDEKNKAGIQVTKKVIDNLMLYRNSDNAEERKLYDYSKKYLDAYTANIREDFYNLLDDMGWTFDSDGSLINKDYNTKDVYGNEIDKESADLARTKLNFDKFYELAREQAANLGMDSKFIECLTPDNFGDPRVPNFLTYSSAKLESIAQSIFNSHITRQTFPGWHAAQITGIGFSKKLKWEPSTGVMEIRLPRWSSLIPKGKTKEENDRILKQIQDEGLDIHIGYRIPTEGKQSITVMKVVGFVEDCLGSTIVVPDEWVTQTGSDFDVDSIYGICWEMHKSVDKEGNIVLHKVSYDEEHCNDKQLYIDYVNNKLNQPVKRERISDAIKTVKELVYEKYKDSLETEKYFRQDGVIKDLVSKQKEAYKQLSKQSRLKLFDIKLQTVVDKNGKEHKDFISYYEKLLPVANDILKDTKDEKESSTLEEYIKVTNKLLNGLYVVNGRTDTLNNFRKEKEEAIDKEIEKLENEYFDKIKNAAKEVGLLTFEDFAQLPFEEKLSRRARNNYILDKIINIMKSPYTKEEQYGRSQFEDISDAKEYNQYISGENNKTHSPYDVLSQIEYQDDVMSGAALKARSVNSDTLTSKNNRIRNKLNSKYSVSFILPTGRCVYTDDNGNRFIPSNGETHAAPIYTAEKINAAYAGDTKLAYDNVETKYVGTFNKDTKGANMAMNYNGKQRKDVKSLSTFEAIINGERTATTRYSDNVGGSLEYWTSRKKGDVVTLFNANKTRAILVKVTKPAHDVTNISTEKEFEDWSKKEGWSVDYLKEQMKSPKWNSGAFQIEYEYIGELKNADKAEKSNIPVRNDKVEKYIEREIGVEEFNDTVWTLQSANVGLTDKELEQLNFKKNSRKGKPIVAVASEHTDPVFHAAKIKKIVEDELAKPAKDRNFNSLYFITKHDGLPLKEMLQLKMPKIVHFSITGLGGSKWEPGVMKADDMLDRIGEYIKAGLLNPNSTTIRIDPIIPGITTPNMINHIVERGMQLGIRNFKFSVMDSYGYTKDTPKDRNIIAGMERNGYKWDENYNRSGTDGEYNFDAKPEKIEAIFNYIEYLGEKYNITFNTCAEAPNIRRYNHIRAVGCLSAKAVNMMLGTKLEEENGVQRGNCSCYGGKFDLLRYNDKCASSCTYCYATHNNDAHVNYYDENGKLKDNIYTRPINNVFRRKTTSTTTTKTVRTRNPERFTLHSGGAIGADSMWADVATQYGIPNTPGRQNHYYYGDKSRLPYANIELNKSEYEEGRRAIAAGAKLAYDYKYDSFKDERIARNWFQVKNADAVYAIGFGINAGERINPDKASDDRIAKIPTVSGGTMYAVNAAIAMHKDVYIFDLKREKWVHCNKNGEWEQLSQAPVLTENFAGIGSRKAELPQYYDVAKKAINDCFARTFGEEISAKKELVNWARFSDNNYEVSSKGDKRFSALYAKFNAGTIIDNVDVGNKTIEDVYQHIIKKSGKGKAPSINSKLYNPNLTTKKEQENFSYTKGYLPLWKTWAKQNPRLIEELRKLSQGKVLTDSYATTRVSQARALADILNEDSYVDNSPTLTHGNYEQSEGIEFNARNIGFSKNDKNVVGDYITTSTAETTAHHLDAVKEGSLKNVNEFTFDAYKLMTMSGLDHWATVTVMYNPVITKLVNANNRINSIYGKYEDSPFRIVLSEICQVNHIGQITEDSSMFDIWNAIVNDKRISTAFLQKYNLDISKISPYKLYEANIPIDISHCIERIKVAKNNRTDTALFIEDAIFDISLLMSFSRLINTGKRINNIAMELNADKYGAKISIHETAKTVNQIENDRESDDTFENNMIDLVYPKDENGNIDERKSSYPSIAACYKYSTLKSLDINRRIFTTESEDWFNAFNDFENNIGHRLTEEEYKQIKNFAIHYLLYRTARKLCIPLGLTEKNHYIKINAEDVQQTQDFYDDEISRIFGYGKQTYEDVNIEDKYNPTEAELKEFNKLSPAQKVLYIQKNFPDDAGIFEYLSPTLVNIFDSINRGGLNRNFINFDESLNNIEDLFALFTNSFQNHNPLIKLAAIDLIKYAFVAEGYKFKYGYISKIITNSSLYESRKKGGLDIIADFKNDIQNLPDNIASIKFASIVLRHNPNLLKVQKLPELPKTTVNEFGIEEYEKENTATSFLNFSNEGFVSIDLASEQGYKLYTKLHLGNKNFVRVQHPITKEINLYRVINGNNKTYLIPLNTLAQDEIGDYSYDSKRNKFYSEEYYLSLCESENVSPKAVVEAKNIKYDYTTNNFTTNNVALSNMIHSFNEKERIAGNRLVSKINSLIQEYNTGGKFNDKVVMISNFELKYNTEYGIPAVQDLDENDGVPHQMKVQITRLTRQQLNSFIDSYNKKQSDVVKPYLYDRSTSNLTDNLATAYLIQDVTPEIETTSDEMNAETELLDEEIEDDMSIGEKLKPNVSELVDVVSKEIISEISFADLKHNNENSKKFLHSLDQHRINKNNRQSLKNNRLTLYRMANAYYRTAANNLLSLLNGFTVIDNGQVVTYKLGDPALYEFLAKNDSYRNQIIKIILDASTFGDRIKDIFDLVDYSENEELGKIINEIVHNINSVRNNTQLNNAMKNIIDIYFRKYSTNPMIVDGLLNLRDTFGDTDKMWSLISNTTEIANSEVQVFLKQIYTMLDKAEMFDAEKNLAEYKKEVEKIKAMPGSIDYSKVFNEAEGKLYQAFNKRFLDDYKALQDTYNSAYNDRMIDEEHFGKYLDAKYKRDEFRFKHTEQKILPHYYKKKLELEKNQLDNNRDAFIKYKYLSAQKWDVDIINDPSEDNKNLLDRLSSEMFGLRSTADETGELKLGADYISAKSLNDYISAMAELNETFFDSQEYDGFQEEYEKYRKYIDRYNARHSDLSLEEKLQDDMYNNAYNWIKSNGYVTFTGEAGKKLRAAYKTLTGENSSISAGIRNTAKSLGIVDKAGIIDARKYTEADIARLKELQENQLTFMYDNGYGECMLIKDAPIQDSILTEEVPSDEEKTAIIQKMFSNPERKTEIIKEINDILKKYIDINGDRIDYKMLLSKDGNEEEIKKLGDLYRELYNLRSEQYKRYIATAKDDAMFTEEIDNARYINARSIIDSNTKNKSSEKYNLLIKLLQFKLSDGTTVINPYLFGYKKIKDEYVDKERTNARKFIQDNVEYVKTEYYYEAYREAMSKGTEYFNDWYQKNHVYNPYSHQYEPLNVWTTIQAKPNTELATSVKYMPSFDNKENFVKKEFINNEENRKRIGWPGVGFKEFGRNYKSGDSRYDNPIKLNDKEEALRQLIENTLNKYATTYQGKRFVGEGFLPRERVPQHNYRWAADQAGQLIGLSTRSGKDSDEYYQDVDYVNDREADFEMLQLLKTKGTKKLPPMPIKGTMSDAKYKEEFEKWQKEYAKIEAENLKLDNAILNKDFMAVMEDFVYNATIFNSRQATKPMLYLLIEDLANNGAYAIKGLWNRHLIKDARSSTSDDTQFQRTPQTNTIEMVKNLARRIIFNQYHNNTPLRKTMNFLQNMASAKFMVFNLYGGIANVATGKVNILMEEFANQYFGFKEFHEAERQYRNSSVTLLRDLYSEKAHNITSALIKKFNVVDFDEILQFAAGGQSMDENLKRLRNALYSFQSVGEHYMQNSVLLAMLKSNRLYTDDKGVTRIGDFKDYSWEIEKNAMRAVVEKYPDIKRYYEHYLNKIKYDKQTLMEINMGTKDLNANFIRGIIKKSSHNNISSLWTTLAEEYRKTRNDMIEAAKKEFLKHKTIESLFEFKDGKAVIKKSEQEAFNKDNNIGDLESLIAQFKEKVISVNQHIHGVYDKKGAALIESKWFGSILMQYKKHLPMGILKHWRRRGYYSEFRGAMERGMYQSVIDFLGMEFEDFGKRVNQKKEDGTNACLASLQVAMESIINTVHNIRSNYNLIPDWQIANMRRNLAEFAGVLLCMAIVAALYAGWDDDKVKSNGWRASLLYLADRLYSETTMYSPIGMSSEWKTTYNSPIASANGPADLWKLMTFTTQYLFDPEFDVNYKTGQYAGRNKFGTIIRRNLPGVRPYDQINFITKRAQYYKLDKSQIGIHAAKNFGEYIHEQ